METELRLCRECGRPVKGRLDKKFCDDYCRNGFNNRNNSDSNNYVRNVNNVLRRNRRMLEAVIPDGGERARCTRQKLAAAGFDFSYHTHHQIGREGATYVFCYEFGYIPMEGDWLLVIRKTAGERPFADNITDSEVSDKAWYA